MMLSPLELYCNTRNRRGVSDKTKHVFTPNQNYQPPKTVIVKPVELENTSFINRAVVYHARRAGVLNTTGDGKIRSDEGHRLVEDFVYSILEHGPDKFKVPKLNIKGCGGFHETPYNAQNADCDFNIMLDIPQDYVSFSHECNRENDVPNRVKKPRYFKGKFTEKACNDPEFIAKWHCKNEDCKHDKPTLNCQFALDASAIQKQFFDAINKGLDSICDISEESPAVTGHPYCFIAGPAITIALQVADHNYYNLNKDITIDLAVAIKTHLDCLHCPSLSELNDFSPQLVPSGTFWRISFSERETEIVKDSSKTALAIYAAAKAIRNEAAPAFPTYPIKQAFLHQMPVIEDTIKHSENKFWILAPCVMTIFNYITEYTAKGEFYNFHQRDDPVLEISDASYEQSKLLKNYMLSQDEYYRISGRTVMAFTGLYLLYNLLLAPLRQHISTGGGYIGLIDMVELLAMIMSLIVFLFVLCSLFVKCKRQQQYGLFGNLYGRGCKINFTFFSSLSFLSSLFYNIAHVFKTDSHTLELSALMLALSSLMTIIIVIHAVSHIVLFAIGTQKHRYKYVYELVLSEQLWLRYVNREQEYILHDTRRDQQKNLIV